MICVEKKKRKLPRKAVQLKCVKCCFLYEHVVPTDECPRCGVSMWLENKKNDQSLAV